MQYEAALPKHPTPQNMEGKMKFYFTFYAEENILTRIGANELCVLGGETLKICGL